MGSTSPRERAILGAVRRIEKHWESLLRCTQQKARHAMRPFVKILWLFVCKVICVCPANATTCRPNVVIYTVLNRWFNVFLLSSFILAFFSLCRFPPVSLFMSLMVILVHSCLDALIIYCINSIICFLFYFFRFNCHWQT